MKVITERSKSTEKEVSKLRLTMDEYTSSVSECSELTRVFKRKVKDFEQKVEDFKVFLKQTDENILFKAQKMDLELL